MILTIILAIINVILSAAATYGLNLPGFDLTLIGVILVGLRGENVLVAAIVLSVAYALPKPDRFVWIPMQVASAWLAGWLALTYDMIYTPIVLFHVLATVWSSLLGNFGGRFLMHTFINIGLTLVIARFYTLMT